jgi:hypothetical protein
VFEKTENDRRAMASTNMASEDWRTLKARVAAAFVALRNEGINARGPVGFDQDEAVQKLSLPGTHRGYAFYHSQDANRARTGQVLWISFGSTTSRARATEVVAVGRAVKDALSQAGLFVEWSGSTKDRLGVYLNADAAVAAKRAGIVEGKRSEATERALRSSRPDEHSFFDGLRTVLEKLQHDGKIRLVFGRELSYEERQREAASSKRTVVVCPSKFLPGWDKISIDVLTYPVEHDKARVREVADALRAAGAKISLVHESYLHVRTAPLKEDD